VLGGAAGPKTAKHIAEFCDGWMPIGGRGLKTGWDEVRRQLLVAAAHLG
jgi:alkanesulfonate monooxygenase SsuD/methylene tetrahydromethanopterin reductase-like flavin-dependent oxidoreductase (luciferase family)